MTQVQTGGTCDRKGVVYPISHPSAALLGEANTVLNEYGRKEDLPHGVYVVCPDTDDRGNHVVLRHTAKGRFTRLARSEMPDFFLWKAERFFTDHGVAAVPSAAVVAAASAKKTSERRTR